jgi:hypothetical protein
VTAAVVRESTFAPVFVDTIDGARATHVAVGGKLRVRIDGQVTTTTPSGPFGAAMNDDVLVITALGAGSGEIEVETTNGYTRIAVSASPIAKVRMAFDRDNDRRATILLLDAKGKQLVDASLRVAPGSAPVSFLRNEWNRVEFETLPPGDVFVKTDLLGATHAIADTVAVTKTSRPSVARN